MPALPAYTTSQPSAHSTLLLLFVHSTQRELAPIPRCTAPFNLFTELTCALFTAAARPDGTGAAPLPAVVYNSAPVPSDPEYADASRLLGFQKPAEGQLPLKLSSFDTFCPHSCDPPLPTRPPLTLYACLCAGGYSTPVKKSAGDRSYAQPVDTLVPPCSTYSAPEEYVEAGEP